MDHDNENAARLRRSATPGILLVGGGGLAVATWVGGDHGLAVGLIVFYVLASGAGVPLVAVETPTWRDHALGR